MVTRELMFNKEKQIMGARKLLECREAAEQESAALVICEEGSMFNREKQITGATEAVRESRGCRTKKCCPSYIFVGEG